ncbi:MAG: hypothetical protein FP832_05085 [Nitrospirae bacterium]|nr:hypothetical protein [Nitrospirota bacterium]
MVSDRKISPARTVRIGRLLIRPKIRQQLQILRDKGILEFTGKGRYKLT